jgi:competence protein ComFC
LACANCLKRNYDFDRTVSVFIYNRVIARAIYRFKFRQKTFLAKFFSKFLLRKIEYLRNKVDFIIPVPIHGKRLKWRGYNQTMLLADELSHQTTIRTIPDLLIKNKNTVAQTTLRLKKRKVNLKSAFSINEQYKDLIRGKNIMITDDVFTTGSTANECAKVLKRNGVKKVFVLTIAKTTIGKKRNKLNCTDH